MNSKEIKSADSTFWKTEGEFISANAACIIQQFSKTLSNSKTKIKTADDVAQYGGLGCKSQCCKNRKEEKQIEYNFVAGLVGFEFQFYWS